VSKRDKTYEKAMEELQFELAGLNRFLRRSGQRLAVIFEGRDAAGKGVRSAPGAAVER